MTPMTLTRRALGAGLAAMALALSGCSEQPAFTGIDISGDDYAQGFSLTDLNWQARTLAVF
mgnify:CR=1 FL=1